MKAINVKFENEDLHTRLKMQVLIEKTTLNKLVVKIIEKYLAEIDQKAGKKQGKNLTT